MSRRNLLFSTVRTEGGLLPQDLLSRIQAGDKDLAGLTPESYHLGPHERIGEAVNRAWSRLTGAWRAFQDALAREPDAAKATGLTRERWLLPLFQELGYGRLPRGSAIEADGKSYAVSHMSPWAPVHLLGAGVDLDRRQAGVSGAAKASPHGLVQEFLNRSEKYLWGFVSNGLQLRILRDHHSLTRQAYVEFDLQALMEGGQYSEFLLLWMICHQSRVEAEKPTDCWLERWFTASRDEGIRALDKLRGGVEKAIESLGTGFLAHRANANLHEALETGEFDKQEYYRQILRLVYRLIFLFVAEERDALLDPQADEAAKRRYLRFYATRRLRELSAKRRGSPHGDVWQGLRLVMSKLDEGCPDLALPALGSRLWGPAACPRLMDAECSNEHLLDAIRHLSNIEEGRMHYPVSWRNVGADELGSIYEGLLELHPRINREAATFVLETAAGHERKTTGSYYTPTELVDCLLDSALDPVLDEACKKPDREAAILGLKVCDPACGSGHFLVAAARRIAKRLAAVRAGEDEPSPREVQHALRDVVGRCIYGVDLNPMAVELCKVSLWMEAIEPGRPLSFLDSHIQCGNALLGATPALMARGIPDEAFKPIEGDDKNVAKRLKQRNRDERVGQMTIFPLLSRPADEYGTVSITATTIDAEPDSDISALRQKEARWEQLTRSPQYRDAWSQADAWCSAFFWPKESGETEHAAVTEAVWRRIRRDPSDALPATRSLVRRTARHYRFLHWHLAFPQVFAHPQSMSSQTESTTSTNTGWEGGFDTILGNPPWIRQEAFKNLKVFLSTYGSFKASADLSVYFLELGINIARHGGRVALLTPNKWIRSSYGEALRATITARSRVVLIVDFGHSKTLFPDADTFPAAVVLESRQIQASPTDEFSFVEAPDDARRQRGLGALIQAAAIRVPHASLAPSGWRLEDTKTTLLLTRIEAECVRLEKYLGRSPLFGIKTGFNQAYCISDSTRERIIRSDPASGEFVRRFVRGRDIGRWKCKESGQWFIVLPSSANHIWPWSSMSDQRAAFQVFEENYPALAGHLRQYEEQLAARSDQGRFWWELRSCDYYEAFERPKILVGNVAWRPEFSLDEDGLYVGDTIYVIPGRDLYLLAILNSRVMWWYFYLTARPMKDDAREYRGVLTRLPVPEVSATLRQSIEEHVIALLSLPGTDQSCKRTELELSLNELIEQAYQLTHEERQVILDSLPPRDPITALGDATSDAARAPAAIDVPAMPQVAPALEATQEALLCVLAILHAAGGSIDRSTLAHAFVLRSKPTLLTRFAPQELQTVASSWASRVSGRSLSAGTLAMALSMLADRDGIKLTTNASGQSLIATSPHTPPEDQLDEWFRFEARLALRILAVVPRARMQDVDSAMPAADWVVLQAVGET